MCGAATGECGDNVSNDAAVVARHRAFRGFVVSRGRQPALDLQRGVEQKEKGLGV